MNAGLQQSMTPQGLLLAAAAAAAAGPSLLAYSVSPSPTFLNQVLALALWGAFVALAALVADGERPARRALRDTALPLLALALVGVTVLWAWLPGALPSALALSAIGMLAATVLLLLSGAAVRASPQAVPLFALFCMGWVMAGVLNAAIGALQVFAPGLPDGTWIARSGLVGRAVCNLRQPNLLATQLLWSLLALAALREAGRFPGWLFAALGTLMIVA